MPTEIDHRRCRLCPLRDTPRTAGSNHRRAVDDEGPDTGPHPVSQDDLRAAFNPGAAWEVVAIDAERAHTRFHGDDGAPAWLATMRRLGSAS